MRKSSVIDMGIRLGFPRGLAEPRTTPKLMSRVDQPGDAIGLNTVPSTLDHRRTDDHGTNAVIDASLAN